MEVKVKADIFVDNMAEVRLEKRTNETTGAYEVLYLGYDAHIYLPEGGFQSLIDKITQDLKSETSTPREKRSNQLHT